MIPRSVGPVLGSVIDCTSFRSWKYR